MAEEPVPTGTVPLNVDPKSGLPIGFGGPNSKPKARATVQTVSSRPGPEVGGVPNIPQIPPMPAAPDLNIISKEADNLLPDEAYLALDSGQAIADPSLLYPKGLTQEMIDSWKGKYGQNRVMMVTINDRVWVFRHLLRPEYRSIKNVEGTDRLYNEERLCAMCMLWPTMADQDWRFESAGLATTLSASILQASGFNPSVVPFKL